MLRDETVFEGRNKLTTAMLRDVMIRERDRMLDKLENLKGRWIAGGRADEPIQILSDIMTGWMNRLLQVFGPSADEATLKSWLLRNNAPEKLVPDVLAEYSEESKRWKITRKDFETSALLKEFGLDDTLVNRTRVQSALFEGRAAALLDVDGRYPAIDTSPGSFVQQTLATSSSEPLSVLVPLFAPPLDIAATDTLETVVRFREPAIDALQARPPVSLKRGANVVEVGQKSVQSEDTNFGLTQTPIQDMVDIAFSGWKSSLSEANRIGIDFDAPPSEVDLFRQHRQALLLFQRILENRGVKWIERIQQADLAAYRDILDNLHPRWGQAIKKGQPYPSVKQFLAAARLRKSAGEKIGLDTATVRRHMSTLHVSIRNIRAACIDVPTLDFSSLTPPKKHQDPAIEMAPYDPNAGEFETKLTPQQVSVFTKLPIYTGCAGPLDDQLKMQGDCFYHGGVTWAPLLLLYSGARRGEIAALEVADVNTKNEIPFILIRRLLDGKSGRGLKNEHSRRFIPLHSEILRLGFMDYVEQVRRLGYNKVFPDLYDPRRKHQDMGDALYKAYTELFSESEEMKHSRFFHSMRHVFSNELKQLGIGEEFRSEICGQTTKGVNSRVYTDPSRLPLKRQFLELYKSVTDHLPSRPVTLFPWIAAKTLSPWIDKNPK